MISPNLLKRALTAATITGSFALVASPALAQGSAYSNGPTTSVEVIAPRFRADTTPVNGPLERVSYSERVPYNDLDLTTYAGASQLRWRIWQTAQNVCGRIAEAYPVYELTSETPCLRRAYDDGMVRANSAIITARQTYWYGYYGHRGYYGYY